MPSCFTPAIRTLATCFAFALLAAGCGDVVFGDDTSDSAQNASVSSLPSDTTTVPSDTTITIPTDTTTTSSPTVDFGPHYDVLTDPAPGIDGDSLFVTVAYSGGCAVHTFPLRGLADSLGGVTLWLHHEIEGGSDDCEAYPSQHVARIVPRLFATLRPLHLVAPDSTRYVLAR